MKKIFTLLATILLLFTTFSANAELSQDTKIDYGLDFKEISQTTYFKNGNSLYYGLNQNDTTTIVLNGIPQGDNESQKDWLNMAKHRVEKNALELSADIDSPKYLTFLPIAVQKLTDEKLVLAYIAYLKLDVSNLKVREYQKDILIYLGTLLINEMYDRLALFNQVK